jgi:hypothetical protein
MVANLTIKNAPDASSGSSRRRPHAPSQSPLRDHRRPRVDRAIRAGGRRGAARARPRAAIDSDDSADHPTAAQGLEDCEHVALAEELDIPLVTFDGEVARAFPGRAIAPESFLRD